MTILRGGEDFLRRHVGGDDLAQNRHDLRHQGSTRVRVLRLGLGLGFIAGLARLGKLVDHLLKDLNSFTIGFGVARHVNGVDSVGESILLSHHSNSLSGL